jgi:predicted GH43/DUF377 family glycosyl hydrolase
MKSNCLRIILVFVLAIPALGYLSAHNHQKEVKHTTTGTINVLPEWALGGFERPAGANPVIGPLPGTKFYCPMSKREVNWEESDTFNPAAVVKGDNIFVLYRAEDNSGIGIGKRTSRIGLAESSDGIKMSRRSTPVMFPDEDDMKKYEWPGGCEDPRVAVTEDGLYVMTYTSWNRDKARLCVATSRDLITWKKHGPAFEDAYQGRFLNIHCKAGSIVTEIKGDKQVITKINNTYFMYWGEHRVWAATSENLLDWKPVLDEKGDLKTVIAPRRGYFDSALTECGPPALKTDKGILLLYNGKNQTHDDHRDRRFNPGTYSAGQVLMDLNDPMKVIERLDVPFFRPMEDFEKSGQYGDGTVFIEGLVYFKGKWYLYYGCADSLVSVAIYDPAKETPGDILPEPL